MVVLAKDTKLPEGAKVLVSLCAPARVAGNAMSAEERQCYLAAMAKIDIVADENPTDNFRGADHDSVLYGETE